MPSIRELKDRINSVRNTLKITSATKLVASAKLRKTQQAIDALIPYEQELRSILSSLSREGGVLARYDRPVQSTGYTAIVVMSSNSSLCGAFNTNIIKYAKDIIHQEEKSGRKVRLYVLGKKAVEALSKDGYSGEADYSQIIAKPSYQASSSLSSKLLRSFERGEYDKVLLVYNHFINSVHQSLKTIQYLPCSLEEDDIEFCETIEVDNEDYLVEPSATELISSLMPQVLAMRFHATVLDSACAEHAARSFAMQTASDNAKSLLSNLTLEYNKSRQQKITAEILDIVGGMIQE